MTKLVALHEPHGSGVVVAHINPAHVVAIEPVYKGENARERPIVGGQFKNASVLAYRVVMRAEDPSKLGREQLYYLTSAQDGAALLSPIGKGCTRIEFTEDGPRPCSKPAVLDWGSMGTALCEEHMQSSQYGKLPDDEKG